MSPLTQGRGLKPSGNSKAPIAGGVVPHAGAWIETTSPYKELVDIAVALATIRFTLGNAIFLHKILPHAFLLRDKRPINIHNEISLKSIVEKNDLIF